MHQPTHGLALDVRRGGVREVAGLAYPVVPRGVILFRLVPTASHDEEDVQRTLEAFRIVRDDMKLNLDAA